MTTENAVFGAVAGAFSQSLVMKITSEGAKTSENALKCPKLWRKSCSISQALLEFATLRKSLFLLGLSADV
ncbi:hypothetical protein MIB92_06085 [Aestuariirhabdus sp. Z084]|uniref:hypothetical protein n=1 Tax=Aestuariirhabdus haliotis TaxID=2918751 RepID=UPI00201B4071|nr:hypothetical protein [Aestuariirhabdus haliotis]MCL6415211.1 hypothetical protein [Aestuariirhabdus haliotis]MCL6419471.1 hypothetical protein [Aestuariirhabdus haliotis]